MVPGRCWCSLTLMVSISVPHSKTTITGETSNQESQIKSGQSGPSLESGLWFGLTDQVRFAGLDISYRPKCIVRSVGNIWLSHLWQSFSQIGVGMDHFLCFHCQCSSSELCMQGACQGVNAQTQWWTPDVRNTIKLKKEPYQTMLACGKLSGTSGGRNSFSANTVYSVDAERLTTAGEIVPWWKESFSITLTCLPLKK